MDMKKIGAFLKSLRKEKGLTQEQLGEKLNVSGRTVSRWETGTNLPDLDVLIILSDFYAVEIRELIEGEKKQNIPGVQEKETLEEIADYSVEKEKRLLRRVFRLIISGICAWGLSLALTIRFINDVNGGALVLLFTVAAFLLYCVSVILIKSNRTVNGYIVAATGAFSALIISNFLLAAVFFGDGTYINHGLAGVMYAFGIIIGVFLTAAVTVTLINKKKQK